MARATGVLAQTASAVGPIVSGFLQAVSSKSNPIEITEINVYDR